MRTVLALAACLTFGSVMAAQWENDFERTAAAAAEAKKSVLLVFGSPEFTAKYTEKLDAIQGLDKYALVVSNDESAKKAINALIDPTMALIDEKGRVYAMVQGLYDIPAEQYAAAIVSFENNKLKRDMVLDLASKKEKGTAERAKLLHEALVALYENGVFQTGGYYGYKEEVDEVKATDTDNSLQLRSRWEYYHLLTTVSPETLEESVKAINTYVDTFKGSDVVNAQRALFLKAYMYVQLSASVKVIETMEEIVALNPNSPLGIQASEFLKSVNEPLPPAEEQPKQ